MPRSVTEIQADLDEIRAAKSKVLKGQTYTTSLGQSRTLPTLTEIRAIEKDLMAELAAAQGVGCVVVHGVSSRE